MNEITRTQNTRRTSLRVAAKLAAALTALGFAGCLETPDAAPADPAAPAALPAPAATTVASELAPVDVHAAPATQPYTVVDRLRGVSNLCTPPALGAVSDNATCVPPPPPPKMINFKAAMADYDGDGITDIAVLGDTGFWFVDLSSNGFGSFDIVRGGYPYAGCIPVPADYDGDGKADFALKCVDANNIGTWLVDYQSTPGNGFDINRSGYGGSNCTPTPGDYDGDRKADLSVKCVDPATGIGTWFVDYAATPQNGWDVQRSGYGSAACVPAPADYNGDHKTDYAVKCGDSGVWFVDYTSTPQDGWDVQRAGYGDGNAIPVPGDFDGDGKADFAIKGSDGTWLIDYSSSPGDGFNFVKAYFPNGTAVVGDFDGDHKSDIIILDKLFAQSTASAPQVLVDRSSNGFNGFDLTVNLPFFSSLTGGGESSAR